MVLEKGALVELLHYTPNASELMESVAEVSYVTQRFSERKRKRSVLFSSGRIVTLEELGMKSDPEVGKPLRGFTKDDGSVKEILPASCDRTVRWLLDIGHLVPLEMVGMTFKLTNISRKASLHLLRYRFCTVNMRSQKYLNQGQFEFVAPSLKGFTQKVSEESLSYYRKCMEQIQEMYRILRDIYEWDAEDARLVLPNSACQEMIFSTNVRELRHLFDIFCDEGYVYEVHLIGMEMLRIAKEKLPIFFEDYKLERIVAVPSPKGFVEWARRDTSRGNNVKVNPIVSSEVKERAGLTMGGIFQTEEKKK